MGISIDNDEMRQTGSMENRLGKDAAILTVSKALTLLISLISSMLLARFRTLDEYGTYAQMTIMVTLVSSLFLLGLPNSVSYFLARADKSESRKQFLSVFYTVTSIVCLIIGLILVFVAPFGAKYFKNEAIKNYLFFLMIFPWTKIVVGSVSNVLVVYGKTLKVMTVNAVNAATTLLSIIIVQLAGWGFREYIILYLVSEVLIAIWIYMIVYRLEQGLNFSFDKELILKIFKYSIPIGLASIVGTLNVEIDKLMIGRLYDTASLAVYTNAGKELPLTMVAVSLTAVLIPQMSKKLKNNDADGAIKLWGHAIELSYIIICFCVSALVVFAPQIMTLLYSEKYIEGVGVFRIYSMVLVLRTTYFGMALNATGKTKFIFYTSLITLGINAILNYLLYLVIGFEGPAVATFISILITNIIQIEFTAKILSVPFSSLFPWTKLGKITAINVLWGILAYAVLKMTGTGSDMKGIGIAIAIGAVAMGIYAFAMYRPTLQLWRKLNNAEK